MIQKHGIHFFCCLYVKTITKFMVLKKRSLLTLLHKIKFHQFNYLESLNHILIINILTKSYQAKQWMHFIILT